MRECEIFKLNFALDFNSVNYVYVCNVGGSVEKLAYTLKRCFTLRVEVYKVCNCGDRPDYSGEISDKFNELTCVKHVFVNEISTVADYNAGYRLGKE